MTGGLLFCVVPLCEMGQALRPNVGLPSSALSIPLDSSKFND